MSFSFAKFPLFLLWFFLQSSRKRENGSNVENINLQSRKEICKNKPASVQSRKEVQKYYGLRL